MENYGSSSQPPHPPPNYPYPYPYNPSPHPNSDPYQYPNPYPYPYPYPSPYHYPPQSQSPLLTHSNSLDYQRQDPFSHPVSYSGPLEYTHHHSESFHYPYPYQPGQVPPHSSPPPALDRQGSSSYGSSHAPYQHQQCSQYPPPNASSQVPSRASSFSDQTRQDSVSSSLYPPLDDLLSNVHLDESNHPSAPASPPAPSAPPVSAAPQSHQNSSWEGAYLGRTGSSGLYSALPYTHSSSFNGSQHSQNMQIVPLQMNKGSLKVLLLHGNLDIWVYDAQNLPNMDMFHKTFGDVLNKLPGNISNRIEGQITTKITSDPYVSISIAGAVIGRTFVISNSENPVWTQHFNVPVAHHAAEVHFNVKDSDVVGSQLIGIVAIPVEQIYSGAKVEGVYPILNGNGKPCKPGATLRLSIQYTSMEHLSIYRHGVGAGPDYHGVLGTYFPLRKGGTVKLYQDAHVSDGSLPYLQLDHGMSYVHGKCWQDIFDAIRQATRLIYITGWSVWHNVRLVRDTGNPSDITLGELLRSKSQEGVRVLLLVWDDPTSRSILGYKTDGIMATHDEETRRFFKHSSVHVLLCPRSAGKRHSWVRQRVSVSKQ